MEAKAERELRLALKRPAGVWMATEEILMAGVRAGGDRQESPSDRQFLPGS